MSPTILNGQSSAGAAKLIHASHVTRERGQQPKYVIGRNRMAQHRRLPRRHRWCSRVRPWWRWTPKSQQLRRKVGAGSVQTQRMFSVVACVAYLYITRSYYCRIQRTINVLLSHIACEVMRPHHQKPDRNITRQTQFCTMKDRMALAKRSSWWVLISETCRQRWVKRWNSMPNSFRRPSVGWQHLPLHLSRSPGIGIHCGRSHVTVRRMGYPEGLAEAADKRSCDSHSGKKCVVGLMLFMAKPLSRRT